MKSNRELINYWLIAAEKDFGVLSMAQRNDKIQLTIHDFLNLLNENGLRVEKAYLFGSHARGNAREGSDIDIAVISKSFSGNRFDDMMSLFEVRRKVDLRIEPIPFHPDDFDEWDPLAGEILSYGIQIWPPKRNGRRKAKTRKRRLVSVTKK